MGTKRQREVRVDATALIQVLQAGNPADFLCHNLEQGAFCPLSQDPHLIRRGPPTRGSVNCFP